MTSTLSSRVPNAEPPWHKTPLNPYLKDSHRALQRWMRSYCDENIREHAAEWEEQGYVPEDAFQRHAKMGLLAASVFPIPKDSVSGIALPAGISPSDWDAFHDMILVDEMARCGYLGVVWGINGGAAVGGPPLATYGTPDQQKKFLRPLLRGEQRHCLAITEPGGMLAAAGSDVSALETTAERSADGRSYVVNGSKKWITQGQWAQYALTAVRTGKGGAKGLSMLLIPLDARGVSKKKMLNSGVHASGSTFLEFDDVEVPVENLIGKEGEGFAIIMSTFAHERVWVGITALRLSRVALEDAYEHALSRQTFGQPLFANQGIRYKFTKMAGMIESTHAYMEQLVLQSIQSAGDRAFANAAALLKFQAARVLEKCTREAQQVFGGLGYSRGGRGGRVEQISRDVRVVVVSSGSEEILMDMYAKQQKQMAKL